MSKQIEEVEKSCLRLVVRAISDFYVHAAKIFLEETDLASDVAEDVTREAMETLGMSRAHIRLYGKVDYKRAAVIFLPDREINVALMIDSKAEKDGNTATIQMSQTSMQIRQLRDRAVVAVDGLLPVVIKRGDVDMQTITIVVKYFYADLPTGYQLKKVKIACIPSGAFQDKYNPSHDQDSIWLAGRNAPTLGEEFRVRLSFSRLAAKSPWRVVEIKGR